MNREETKQAIEVMQAWIDGEDIECVYIDPREGRDWVQVTPCEFVLWSLTTHHFRIKPRPREFWIVLGIDNTKSVWPIKPTNIHGEYIKVREVISDD